MQKNNSDKRDKEERPLSRVSSGSSSVFPIERYIKLSKQTEKAESNSKTPCKPSEKDSSNSMSFDKYAQLKGKCDKNSENSKISSDFDSSVLKPLPPNFTHRVLSDSFVNEDHKKNLDINKEIYQSGVQSFFRKNKELTADNTYNTEPR